MWKLALSRASCRPPCTRIYMIAPSTVHQLWHLSLIVQLYQCLLLVLVHIWQAPHMNKLRKWQHPNQFFNVFLCWGF